MKATKSRAPPQESVFKVNKLQSDTRVELRTNHRIDAVELSSETSRLLLVLTGGRTYECLDGLNHINQCGVDDSRVIDSEIRSCSHTVAVLACALYSGVLVLTS
jgi:hypothetical protein